MKLAGDSGYPKLWLEGDSLNIINMLNNKNSITWSIEATVMEIKSLINKSEKIIISHTVRLMGLLTGLRTMLSRWDIR